jgi:hypothetical protein
MRKALVIRFCAVCALWWLGGLLVSGQEAPPASQEETKPEIPEIADEPKTIDPAEFMPAPLAERVTVEFKDSSLREIFDWFRDERKLVVLVDSEALAEREVLPSDPVSDRLSNAPAYLLLNRMSALGVAWYFEDEVLHITTAEKAEEHMTTISHGVGDLLDAGFNGDALIETITGAIAPETWEEVGGPGAVSLLGDVLFVRQRDDLQREVRGLLAALRKHGRRTFVFDAPEHLTLRQKLDENVSVDFRDTPLESAVRELAEKAQIDIRLDEVALREAGVRDRHPISVVLTDRKLKTVLQAMLNEPNLTWSIRDAALWITTDERGEEWLKTAVYDVRDLCRDEDESKGLREAIMSQAEPEAWENVGGPADLIFPRPGTLVVNAPEDLLDEVLSLLEAYREALRASKPRRRPEDEANKVVTVYYRMHANMADSLSELLPKLVRPDSWRNAERPEAPGEVIRAASKPDPINPAENKELASELVIARAVLIVKQTQAAHDEIREIIRRVGSGDALDAGGFGGGLGGGGFGGGFFGVPDR